MLHQSNILRTHAKKIKESKSHLGMKTCDDDLAAVSFFWQYAKIRVTVRYILKNEEKRVNNDRKNTIASIYEDEMLSLKLCLKSLSINSVYFIFLHHFSVLLQLASFKSRSDVFVYLYSHECPTILPLFFVFT